ncbi:MAG: FAD-dependent oxidoreductase [Spirochaetales bacterium]|jgi:glycerol-3-phosphate dehydrogenase
MEAPFAGLATQSLPLARCEVKKKGAKVCVIGGGGTGAALAYDLAQRGLDVILLEKGELTSGTTGRHHGQLHCGARYAWNDKSIARECYEESLTLARIAGDCIEYNGGFFVALNDEEAALRRKFIENCAEAGIPSHQMRVSDFARLEPAVSGAVKAAVLVPDGSFDAFRLPMMFFAAAVELGARILPWREVVGLEISAGRMKAVIARNLARPDRREERIEVDYVVSAAGAWAGQIARLAGISISITLAPGTMLAVKGRVVNHVISRLRPPGDGDILVPQRGLSIIGSTQSLALAGNPEGIIPSASDIEFLRGAGAEMLPDFASMPTYAAWAAARPLAGKDSLAAGDVEGRSLSRDFSVIDHESEHGIAGFASVIGGKATVLRAMAEKAADQACAKLGIQTECRTSLYALPSWREYFREAR